MVISHYITNFTLTRSKISNIDPFFGLLIFQEYHHNYTRKTFGYDFVSFDIRIPSKRSIFTLGSEAPPGYVEITQSCNGLFLCRIQLHKSHAYKYYVYNPTTKLFKMLPKESRMLGVRMAFDPTKSLHYKVIHVNVIHDDGHPTYIQIETYSSESDKLSVYGDRFDISYFSSFKDGIYWNDAIHWLEKGCFRSSHCKLQIVNELPVLTIQHLEMHFRSKLFESRGSLLLCMAKFNSECLTIFEMRNGYSEWSVKFTVNFADFLFPFPNISKIGECVWSIVLGERDEDSFMIIDLRSRVIRYNPVLKTVCTLSDLRSLTSYNYDSFNVYQISASFAGV